MIQQTQCASFLAELYTATHDLDNDTLKMALYHGTFANINAATTEYIVTGEIVGTGYVAGGATITGVVVVPGSNGAYIDFDNVVWSGAAFTARGALIYNASKANRAIAVLDFGADKTCTTTFTVALPAAALDTALIRTTLGI